MSSKSQPKRQYKHVRRRKKSKARIGDDEEREKKHEEKVLKEKLDEEAERRLLKEPHSMVIHRGDVGQYVRRLEKDIRSVMEPFTASKLKVLKRNNLKDFIVNGAVLGVTHLLVLTRGENWITLRIIRSPHGPTLTFRIKNYTLTRHVLSSLKRKMHYQEQFVTPPLVIMSGFTSSEERHIHLTQSIFQNMFPTVNVDTVKLSTVRRCVLLNYDADSDSIEFRHYAIKAVPSGLSKSAKKLVQSKVPDLSKYKDIGDYFLDPGQLSESEYEFDQKEVELPQDLSTRGCKIGQKTNIRLYELGPRMTLQLIKIEEGIDEGEVLYHAYIKKSTEELVKLRKELPKKRKLKEREQKRNEYRVIRRLEEAAKQKEALDEQLKEEREKLIRKQKEVTGDYQTDEQETNANSQNVEQHLIEKEPRRKRRRK